MSDEDAYMALVTSNAQSELTALERGLHALAYLERRGIKRGKRGPQENGGLTKYAKTLEVERKTLEWIINAAEVWKSLDINVQTPELARQPTLLDTVHVAPEWLWPALVRRLLADRWTVDAARKQVERSNCPLWPAMSAIARTTGRQPCRRTLGFCPFSRASSAPYDKRDGPGVTPTRPPSTLRLSRPAATALGAPDGGSLGQARWRLIE
jgi:hypothetical protein